MSSDMPALHHHSLGVKHT